MIGQQIGYVRVSTIDQNISRQLDGVELDIIFTDKCSGKNSERPELNNLIRHARYPDTVHVHSLDRLARNIHDLWTIIKKLSEKRVNVKFHKENIEFNCSNDGLSALHELMFNMLGSFAQFERSIILERQREGIAIAKREKRYKGGVPKLTLEQADRVRKLLETGVSKSEIARQLNITRQTIYSYLKPDRENFRPDSSKPRRV